MFLQVRTPRGLNGEELAFQHCLVHFHADGLATIVVIPGLQAHQERPDRKVRVGQSHVPEAICRSRAAGRQRFRAEPVSGGLAPLANASLPCLPSCAMDESVLVFCYSAGSKEKERRGIRGLWGWFGSCNSLFQVCHER